MSMISAPDAEHIREFFGREMEGDVKISYFTQPKSRLVIPGRPQQDCLYCEETQQLLEE